MCALRRRPRACAMSPIPNGCDSVGAWVSFVVVVGLVAVDDVDVGALAAAGERDVALLERGHVGRVVAGDVVGCALDAVARACVAVFEAPGGEVGVGDADRAFAFERDDHLLVVDGRFR